MELIKSLERKLNKQWQKVATAKTQDEAIKARAEAMETFRLLKKQSQFNGALAK